MRLRAVLVAIGGLSFIAMRAEAQSGKTLSAQGSFLYVGLSGDAYEGLNAGVGAEAQIRYNFPNPLSIGAGFQYSRHEFDEAQNIPDPLSLVGVFVEPRWVIRTSSLRLFPYVSARIAFLSQNATFDGEDVSASGTQINGGGGLLFAVSGNAVLDVGATFGAVSFGDYGEGAGEAGSGSNVVFRVGISMGLGR